MSDDLESSRYGGKPVHFYEFLRTSGGLDYFWRYNSSDRDITLNEEIYKAVPISDDGVRLSSEAASTEFTVTMPITEEFCAAFRMSGTLPSDTVSLTVRRAHGSEVAGLDGGDPTVAGPAYVVWIGTVDGISQTDEITARITCSMLTASFRRGGLRYGYQRNCPHVLYAPIGCKVNKELYRVTTPVISIDGLTIHGAAFAGHPDGWFDGGFIEYALPSGPIERRMIVLHEGDALTIIGFPAGLGVGQQVSAFPGCDLTVDTCINKFDNLLNMGGFPHTPGRNPFDGQPVFL